MLWQKSEFGGTRLSLDPFGVLNCLFRQTVGALPGLELAVNRTCPDTVGPWCKSASSPFRPAASTAWPAYLLAFTQAGVFAFHLFRSRCAAATTWPLLAGTFVACLLPNPLIGVTVEYQIWAWHRTWPYFCSSYVFAVILALFVFAAVRVDSGGRRPGLRVGIVVSWGLLFVSGKISNTVKLELLRSWYNS